MPRTALVTLALSLLVCLLPCLLSACGSKSSLTVDACDACCVPQAERCNGADDDCDGVADDGIFCFSLDGEAIEPLRTETCGAEFYAYDAPDPESANPRPDVRISDGVVVVPQFSTRCNAGTLSIIADLPMDGSGGQFNADFTVAPVGAAGLLVGDEPRECSFDAALGRGRCEFVWQPCCTDGVMLGPFTGEDACVTVTLSDAVGVRAPIALDARDTPDGMDREVPLPFGVPFEFCGRSRPAVP